MGRSIAYTYRIKYVDNFGRKYDMGFKGRATNNTLSKWVGAMNLSMSPGGHNEHLSDGVDTYIVTAQVEDNVAYGQPMRVLATYNRD